MPHRTIFERYLVRSGICSSGVLSRKRGTLAPTCNLPRPHHSVARHKVAWNLAKSFTDTDTDLIQMNPAYQPCKASLVS